MIGGKVLEEAVLREKAARESFRAAWISYRMLQDEGETANAREAAYVAGDARREWKRALGRLLCLRNLHETETARAEAQAAKDEFWRQIRRA